MNIGSIMTETSAKWSSQPSDVRTDISALSSWKKLNSNSAGGSQPIRLLSDLEFKLTPI